MRGIILAGGSGTRLFPLTRSISKQLLPVYDKPMIYYSLTTLIMIGVTDVLVVVDPKYYAQFSDLLGDGSDLGIKIEFVKQVKPNGIAEAFLIGENFISGEEVSVILGDNVFHGAGLGRSLNSNIAVRGAKIFAKRVSNPQDYGVVEFDPAGKVISIEEKPRAPKSRFAVPGLYFYDNQVVDIAKNLLPSARGELEISDVNNAYLEMGELHVEVMPRGASWIDAGNFEALADATDYVRAIERREGLKIGCPEEVAWRMGLITDDQLASLAERLIKSGYGRYLLEALEQGK